MFQNVNLSRKIPAIPIPEWQVVSFAGAGYLNQFLVIASMGHFKK